MGISFIVFYCWFAARSGALYARTGPSPQTPRNSHRVDQPRRGRLAADARPRRRALRLDTQGQFQFKCATKDATDFVRLVIEPNGDPYHNAQNKPHLRA